VADKRKSANLESRAVTSGIKAFTTLSGTDADSTSKPFKAGYTIGGFENQFYAQSDKVGYSFVGFDYTLPTTTDSANIYASTPAEFTTMFCSDCSGDGITGRIVAYIGAAWRRLKFD
jgi:hypothetical protein